jgi:hypothetical protein
MRLLGSYAQSFHDRHHLKRRPHRPPNVCRAAAGGITKPMWHWRSKDRETDVADDDAQATTRATGGVPNDEAPDQGSTTGTTPSGDFVGRVQGQDVGYAGETGAERRAAVAEAEDDD